MRARINMNKAINLPLFYNRMPMDNVPPSMNLPKLNDEACVSIPKVLKLMFFITMLSPIPS